MDDREEASRREKWEGEGGTVKVPVEGVGWEKEMRQQQKEKEKEQESTRKQ